MSASRQEASLGGGRCSLRAPRRDLWAIQEAKVGSELWPVWASDPRPLQTEDLSCHARPLCTGLQWREQIGP